MTRALETTAIAILEGDASVSSIPDNDALELIDHLQAWLPNYPKSSNKFISFLQQHVSPIYAVYGVYSAVDNGSLELTSRNFQSMLLFESEFKDLIKHFDNPDKKTNFFESILNGTDISKVELELTSPFCIQPEDEIGTGTWEYVEPEPVATDDDDDTTAQTTTNVNTSSQPGTFKVPFKDILDKASKKVLGVGVKKTDDRDAYHVFTQYIYQFTPDDNSDLTISVASQQYWDEHDEIDDKPIAEYLEHFIPTWANNWTEVMPSVFQYTGGSTKADAIAYLNATGFFKEHQMFDSELSSAELLMAHLEDQPKEVIAKFLNAALEYLDEDVIDTLLERYKDGWHEYTSK